MITGGKLVHDFAAFSADETDRSVAPSNGEQLA
jgi:hypothetical protein